MAILDLVPVARKFQDRKPKERLNKEYVGIAPGGRPITSEEQNIQNIRQKYIEPVFEPIGDVASRAARRVGDFFVPGQPFMQGYRQNKAVKQAQDLQFEKKMILRKQNPKEVVRARAGEMFEAAVKKYEGTGNPETLVFAENAIKKMITDSGYAPQEFGLPGTIDVEAVDPDPYQLDTTRPNPFPELEISAEIIMGTGASLYGATNTGARTFRNLFKRGAQIGARAPVPGAWKFASSIFGGAFGVAAGYFGYELGLDLFNQANKSKAELEGRDPKTYMINRPGLGSRLYRSADLALTDAALGGIILGFRPAYNSLRNVVRNKIGGVDRSKDMIKRGQELVDKFPTGGYGTEGKLPAELGSIPITPIPGGPRAQVGKTGIDDIAELRRGLFPFYWGNIERGAGEMPIQGTVYSIATAGRPALGTTIETGGKFPYLGGGIKMNLEEQGTILVDLFHNMFAAYGPVVATRELMSNNILMAKRKTASRYLANLKRKLNRFRRHARETGYTIDSSPIRATMEGILDDAPKTRRMFDQEGRLIEGYGNRTPEYGLTDLTRFPEGERSFYNWVNNTLQDVVGNRRKFSIVELEKLFKDIEYYARRYKDNPDVMKALTRVKMSTEASLGTVANSEARRLLDDFDNYATNGMLLFDSAAAKKFNAVDRYGFTLRLAEQGPKAADDLFSTAWDANHPSVIRGFKNIVGPDVFNQTTRRFLQDAFEASVEEGPKEGIKKINFAKFKNILGLDDTASNRYQSLKEMMPGANPSVSEGRVATATDSGSFNSTKFDATIRPNGLIPGAVMEGPLSSTAPLPTVRDLETWVEMVEDVFKYGVPDISTFIARRAQISGLRGAIKSFMPLSGISPAAHGGSAAVAASTGFFGSGIPLLAVAGTVLIRHLAKIISNPINMRVYKNAIDYKLPERARNAAMVRFFHVFRNEIEQIDKELEQMEYEATRPQGVQPRGIVEGIKDRIVEGVSGAAQAIAPARPQPQANASPVIPQVETEVETTSVSNNPVEGSSLAQSNVLTPGAAQALYTGDTDAALAAQFNQPTMAAEGGLISLKKR